MKKESKLLESEKLSTTAIAHVTTNSTFVFISITVFTFAATINADLLKDMFLSLQLFLSILFFSYATFARSKMIANYTPFLSSFGTYIFTIGFILFINSLVIIMARVVSVKISIIVMAAFLLLIVIYGVISNYSRVMAGKNVRVIKELLSIVIAVAFGLMHVLNYY